MSATVDVLVTAPGGQSAVSNQAKFTYLPQPTIASVAPGSVLANSAQTVTLTGVDDLVADLGRVPEAIREYQQALRLKPEMVEENVWGATTQEGDQGLTLGRTSALLAGLPDSCSGFSVDRMCAGGLTAITAEARARPMER